LAGQNFLPAQLKKAPIKSRPGRQRSALALTQALAATPKLSVNLFVAIGEIFTLTLKASRDSNLAKAHPKLGNEIFIIF
jgi:hypothetical protein